VLFSGLTHARHASFTIGIILGNPASSASSYDDEKLCIIEPLEIDIQRQHHQLKFVRVYNYQSIVGTVVATQQLLAHNVDLVLLPIISSQAKAAAAILEQHKVPFLTTGSLDSLISDPANSLSIMPANRTQAKALAKFTYRKFKRAKILTIADISDPYSVSMRDEFKQSLYQLNPSQNISDFEFADFNATKIAAIAQHIDVIFAPIYNPDIAYLYAALAKYNKVISIIGPDSIDARHEFFSIIGQSSQHVELAFIKNWDAIIKGPNQLSFTALQKTYCENAQPSFENSYSYDLMNLLQTVFAENKNIDKSNIIRHIKSSQYINVTDGVKYQFNARGFNNKPLYLCKIAGKSSVLLTQLAGD